MYSPNQQILVNHYINIGPFGVPADADRATRKALRRARMVAAIHLAVILNK